MYGREDFKTRIVERPHKSGTVYGVEVTEPVFRYVLPWYFFGRVRKVYQEPQVRYGGYDSRGFPIATSESWAHWGTQAEAEHLERLLHRRPPEWNDTPIDY